jgi:hypothetical protein
VNVFVPSRTGCAVRGDACCINIAPAPCGDEGNNTELPVVRLCWSAGFSVLQLAVWLSPWWGPGVVPLLPKTSCTHGAYGRQEGPAGGPVPYVTGCCGTAEHCRGLRQVVAKPLSHLHVVIGLRACVCSVPIWHACGLGLV